MWLWYYVFGNNGKSWNKKGECNIDCKGFCILYKFRFNFIGNGELLNWWGSMIRFDEVVWLDVCFWEIFFRVKIRKER